MILPAGLQSAGDKLDKLDQWPARPGRDDNSTPTSVANCSVFTVSYPVILLHSKFCFKIRFWAEESLPVGGVDANIRIERWIIMKFSREMERDSEGKQQQPALLLAGQWWGIMAMQARARSINTL